MPATVTQTRQSAPPPTYGTSFAFDFGKGDFILDGNGRVVTTDGETSWAVWCAKAAITQWLAYPIYTARYGTDLAAVSRAPSRALAQATAGQVISDALRADPRTKSVDQFTFTWNGDALSVSFVVTPRVGTTRPITVKVTS